HCELENPGQEIKNRARCSQDVCQIETQPRQDRNKPRPRQKQEDIKKYGGLQGNSSFLRSQSHCVRYCDSETSEKSDAAFRPQNESQHSQEIKKRGEQFRTA